MFQRLLSESGKHMVGEVGLLVTDDGFRRTVSNGNAEAITAALNELLARIHGQRAF